MRILVVGAGAVGGYFGGRLLEAKRDVTFLVRAHRAAQLRATGLVIKSPRGDFSLANPPCIEAAAVHQPFDLILLSCKAYDLEGAIQSFAPAVGPDSAILPLLNGMRHLDVLDVKVGAAAVLGGQCVISTALDAEGRILHFSESHSLTFGERQGGRSSRTEAIRNVLAEAAFDMRLSENILQEMWEKWTFIAAFAGITCLMRAAVGDIVSAGATEWATRIYDECVEIAAQAGFAPGERAKKTSLQMLTAEGSKLTASMLRDIESGGRIEADHILGDLLRRRKSEAARLSVLAAAYLHVKAYEARRQRELDA
jgi:2-dehydropantoate 2-reductase